MQKLQDILAIPSVSIPGRVFLFPGIRERQFSFPGMTNIMRD